MQTNFRELVEGKLVHLDPNDPKQTFRHDFDPTNLESWINDKMCCFYNIKPYKRKNL